MKPLVRAQDQKLAENLGQELFFRLALLMFEKIRY